VLSVTCYRCGSEIEISGKPSRQELCPKCSAYLHCCLNCEFYDPNAHQQCREPQAELVQDKEGANFCDYFRPLAKARTTPATSRQEEARRRLDQLFKKA
jgi:hypothetical protein